MHISALMLQILTESLSPFLARITVPLLFKCFVICGSDVDETKGDRIKSIARVAGFFSSEFENSSQSFTVTS